MEGFPLPQSPVRMAVTHPALRQDTSSSIGMRPDEPGYRERMQPPEDHPQNELPTDVDAALQKYNEMVQAAQPPAIVGTQDRHQVVYAPPQKRVTVSYGPKEGIVVIAVEQAPDWDVVDGGLMQADLDAVKKMMPILRQITTVKCLVPDLYL